LIKSFLEKYLKNLIGKTDIEDALKRLDNLTNEEARMVNAQVFAVVIDGVQPPLIIYRGNMLNSDAPRGKRGEGNHTTSGRRHGSSETLVIFLR
jgi:hypothetical protein